MNLKDIEHMWKVASNNPNHDTNWHDPVVVAFAEMIKKKTCEELARKIEKMPFGDTAASFALWIKNGATTENEPETIFRKWPRE